MPANKDGSVDIRDVTDYVWAKYDGDLDDLRDCARSIVNTDVYKEDGRVPIENINEFAGGHTAKYSVPQYPRAHEYGKG